MLSIIYTSDALEPFDVDSLRELALNAAIKNRELDITGYLFYERGRFFQYIEGNFEVTRNLLKIINKDKRHKIIKVLEQDGLEKRRFPSWHMQYLSMNSLQVVKKESIIIEKMRTMRALDIPSDNVKTQKMVNELWALVNVISKNQNLLTSSL